MDEARFMDVIIELISGIRSIRGESNISPSIELDAILKPKSPDVRTILEGHINLVKRLARVKGLSFVEEDAPKRERLCSNGRHGNIHTA